MKKNIIFIILTILLLTGCYNYKDLNDLAIVSGISVAMSGHEYEVTVEIVNPKKQQDAAGSEEPDFIIYKSKDSSIQEAIRKVIEESPKKLYTAHMNILIIDEEIAKNHLPDILDFFARDPEIRNEFYVLIGKDKDILPITTPLENISSENILDSLKANYHYLGYTNMVTYHDLLNTYLNPYQELAISSVEIVGDEKKGDDVNNIKNTQRDASSVISGIGIFKNNKLVGYLKDEDVLVYNIVTNHTDNFLVQTNYSKNHFFVCEILQENTNISVNIEKKKIRISLSGRATLAEENILYDLEKNETIDRLQKDMNQTIEDMVFHSLTDTIQKYHTDIYGFQNMFYHQKPSFITNFKGNWNDDILDKLDIDVKSNIKIVEKGNLNGGLIHE